MSARPRPAGWVSLQGQYAGTASRFLAYAIDLVVSTAVFTLAVAGVSFVIETVTRHSITWTAESGGRDHRVVRGLGVLLLRVLVGGQRQDASAWRCSGSAWSRPTALAPSVAGRLRALVFPFSFLFLGLGFLGILVRRERQALHDLIAGTAVVYAWDARAARLRFLARESETGQPSARRPARVP